MNRERFAPVSERNTGSARLTPALVVIQADPDPFRGSEASARRWAPTMTLFAQALALSVLSLLAAIAITVLVIFNLPPPMPDFYRVSDIAQVYKTGKPFSAPDRPLLLRTISTTRPTGDEVPASDMYLVRRQLSSLIGADPKQILMIIDFPRFADRQAIKLVRSQMAHDARFGEDHFLIAPFSISTETPDHHWITVAPKPSAKPTTWQQRILLWLGLSVLALIPLAYLFSRRLAAPIASFAAAAEALGRDPRTPPLVVRGPSEISVAVQAFNNMQQRLARYVDDRTAMVGAIAHDLRTPLTRLRFRLEDVPETVRGKMAGDLAEMEAMISGAIAFVRDATTKTERVKMELSSLLESLADEMSETGLDVTVETAERVVVDGDPIGLRRLFNNLLDNAIKFGGRARVRVLIRAGEAVIEIDDDGRGLPAEELERVFEPFYRCDASRSKETGGIGLGLPVVRSISRSHGGDTILVNRKPRGLTAIVNLPLVEVVGRLS